MQQTKQFRHKKEEDKAEELRRAMRYKEKPAKGDYATWIAGKHNRRMSAAEKAQAAAFARAERERAARARQSEAVRDERGDELRKAATAGDVNVIQEMLAKTGKEMYPLNQPSDDGAPNLSSML